MFARLRTDRTPGLETIAHNDNPVLDRQDAAGGWLGITMQNITSALAEALGLESTAGVLVASVAPDGPAEAAGLMIGAVISAYNGQKIGCMRDLADALADTVAGRRIAIGVVCDGRPATLFVTIGEARGSHTDRPVEPVTHESPRLGLFLGELSDGMRAELRLPQGAAGMAVLDLRSGGLADRAGIRTGDAVLRIDGCEMRDPVDAANAVKRAELACRTAVAVLLNRGGQNRFVGIKLRDGKEERAAG